ncbi:hypothetical protein CMI37_07395 [Candidatus Pacearchaeota archaeon]|nr:hypothetical protein [Candidatus Pacearchaeota archaeon]
MPQEKIIIKFEKKGDPELIKALNNLAKAQANVKKGFVSAQKATQQVHGEFSKLNPTLSRMHAQLKLAGKSFIDLGISQKTVTAASKGSYIAMERLRLAMAKANKEGLLSVRNNRLIANSFATLRSQLLLVSFGAMLVERAFVSLVKSYGRQEAANKKLQVGLSNVADTTPGVTQRLIDYSAALQQTTAFGDELITTGMVQLTTFGLNEEAIKGLTKQVLNVARAVQTATGTMPELNSLFIAFGKATTTGIGTLTRYGVVLTEAERAQLKNMDASERGIKITAILERQYGGLADAYAKTTIGMLEAAAAAKSDLAEAFGKALAPAVIMISKALKAVFDAMTPARVQAFTYSILASAGAMGVAKIASIGLSGAIAGATRAMAFFTKVSRKNPFIFLASVAAIAGGAIMSYFGVFEDDPMDDAAKRVEKLNAALEEDIRLAKELKAAQDSGTKSLQKQLDLLNAKTDVEKMLINLGHKASTLERTLIDQIVEKTAAIKAEKQALKDAEKARSDAMKQSEKDFNAAVDAQELAIATEKRAQQQHEKMFPTLEQYSAEMSKKVFIERANQEVLRQWIAANQDLAASLKIETDVMRIAREEKEKLTALQDKANQQTESLALRIAILKIETNKQLTETEKDEQKMLLALGAAYNSLDPLRIKEILSLLKIKERQEDLNAARTEGKNILESSKKALQDRLDILAATKTEMTAAEELELKRIEATARGVVIDAEWVKLQEAVIEGEKQLAAAKETLNEKMRAENQIKSALASTNAEQLKALDDLLSRLEEADDGTLAYAQAIAKVKEEMEDLSPQMEQLATLQDLYAETYSAISGIITDSQNKTIAGIREENQLEIAELKKTTKYKRATAKEQQKMENDVKKKRNAELVRAFRAQQIMQVGQVWMNIALAIAKEYGKLGLAGIIAQPILMGIGAIQSAAIMAQQPPKLQRGGMIGGKRHSQGGTLIEAEEGEFIVNREAVSKLGIDNLEKINNLVNVLQDTKNFSMWSNIGTLIGVSQGRKDKKFQEGGLIGSPPANISNMLSTPDAPAPAPAQITINLSGNVMTDQFVEEELADKIKEAVRRGTDFGIS